MNGDRAVVPSKLEFFRMTYKLLFYLMIKNRDLAARVKALEEKK